MNILPEVFSGCYYGSSTNAQGILFEYHIVSFAISFSMIAILFSSASLGRFYSPLARWVNISITLQLICAIIYFIYYPYADNESNCGEFFLRRICIMATMIGELHQIYLVANVTGVGELMFTCLRGYSASLEGLLNICTVVMIVSIPLVFLYLRRWAQLMDAGWTLFSSQLQIYVIHKSRAMQRLDLEEGVEDGFLVSPNSSAIKTFEKMSMMQICLSIFSIALLLFPHTADTHHVPVQVRDACFATMDILCTTLFYVKAIMVQENTSSVTIDFAEQSQKHDF